MINPARVLFLIVSFLLLEACSVYSMVPPGETRLGVLKVHTSENWSQVTEGDVVAWTKDGLYLNNVVLDKVSSGKHIAGAKLTEENQGFVYRPGEPLEDTLELFIDSLSAAGLFNVELDDFEPLAVDGFPAVRFHYHYDTEDNLTYRAKGLLVERQDELHRLRCIAPGEHYYPKLEAEFERIVSSVTFL